MYRTTIIRPKYTTKVTAAEEDNFDDLDFEDDDAEGLMDAVDDVAESVEDIQDTMDEVDEDDVDIATNNNISNHDIAECDKCHGVFISAVLESEEEIDHVSGICPLCQKESEQYLKWIIRDVEDADEEQMTEEEMEEAINEITP